MKMALASLFSLAVLVSATSLAFAEDILPGQIHGYPPTVADSAIPAHQLPFERPKDGIARAEFRSQEFFAIILKSGERCSFTEAERQDIQLQLPANKVFMDFFACDEAAEDTVQYSNVNPDYSFIAVFGGLEIEETRELFETMDLGSRFPGANIRKMQAILVFP